MIPATGQPLQCQRFEDLSTTPWLHHDRCGANPRYGLRINVRMASKLTTLVHNHRCFPRSHLNRLYILHLHLQAAPLHRTDFALPLRNHLLDFGHLRQHLRSVVDTPSDLVKFHRSIHGNRTLNSTTPARSMAWTFQRPSDQASSPTTKTLNPWNRSRFLFGNSCVRACTTSGYDELPMAAKPMSSRLTILELTTVFVAELVSQLSKHRP